MRTNAIRVNIAIYLYINCNKGLYTFQCNGQYTRADR